MKSTKKISNRKEQEPNNIDNKSDRLNIKVLAFALLLILVVLSAVMILRLAHGKPVLPRGESYYNLRIAQALESQPFLDKDPVQGTSYELNPYHYLLALLLTILPIGFVIIFLPLIMGLASAFLFFKSLLITGIRYQQAAYALIVLSVTPAFIILFTGLYSTGFVIFLSLLIGFLILKHKKSRYELALCILLFMLLALTSLTGLLITSLAILFLCLALKRKPSLLFIPLVPSVLAIGLLSLLSNHAPRLLGFHIFEFRNTLSILRADLGFDLFLLVLFFSGFIISWVRHEQSRLFHLAMLGLLTLSLFNDIARVFSSFIITIYCVSAITYFYMRKWGLEIIRIGTLLLVLCSLVFSLTSQVNTIVKAQPDQDLQKALVFLKGLGIGSGKVLTTEENGFLVEFYSDKNVLLDSNSFLLSSYSETKNASNLLFMAARLKDAEPLLKQHKILYVLITPDMKEDLWEGREQGLWLVVMNSESFVRRYSSKGVGIWEYNPSTTPLI